MATRDMGALAARILADDSWTEQQEIAVLGPEDLSMNDMAQIMTEVLGRAIRYQQVSFDDFKQQLAGHGMSESFLQGYVDMMRAKNEGMDNAVVEARAITRLPTSFRQWCTEELKAALQG